MATPVGTSGHAPDHAHTSGMRKSLLLKAELIAGDVLTIIPRQPLLDAGILTVLFLKIEATVSKAISTFRAVTVYPAE